MALLDVIAKRGQQLCCSLLRTSIFGEQELFTAQRAHVAYGFALDVMAHDERGFCFIHRIENCPGDWGEPATHVHRPGKSHRPARAVVALSNRRWVSMSPLASRRRAQLAPPLNILQYRTRRLGLGPRRRYAAAGYNQETAPARIVNRGAPRGCTVGPRTGRHPATIWY